jgi:hypothetical protein
MTCTDRQRPRARIVAAAALAAAFVTATPSDGLSQPIASFTLSAPSSACAQDIVARVTLSAPAPPQGSPVQLSSSIPAVLSVPNAITVASGATTASATLRCTPSAQALAVTITATGAGSSQSAVLNVLAPALDRITIKANDVLLPNGARVTTSFTAAAGLLGPAPAGGVIVTLTTDQPTLASVPASVTVPAGQATANFTVSNIRAVAQPTTITVTGTGLGASRAIAIPLSPPVPVSLMLQKILSTESALVPVDTMSGGKTTYARLQLSVPAGQSGLNVRLASSNAAVSVAPTVTVLAGDSTARIPLTSALLAQTTSATISATVGSVTKSATLVVSAVTVEVIAATPNRVVGGQPVEATVYTMQPAPAGGLVVQLSSSSVNTLRTPPSVTIPAGATSATFAASTFPVTAASVASITATVGSVSRSVTIAVAVEGISDFTTSAASVQGGARLTGRLEAPAGHDGFTVLLTSPSPEALALPASVTFAAGETSRSFLITSAPVKSPLAVVLSARVVTTVTTVTPGSVPLSQLVPQATRNVAAVGVVEPVGSGGVVRTVTVTVVPPRVGTVALSPAVVIGGSNTVITGTVTLNGPAPEGLVVNLTSDAELVGLDADFVRFSAGATSAAFTARTLPVTRSTTVDVTAEVSGGRYQARRATVTVTPKP